MQQPRRPVVLFLALLLLAQTCCCSAKADKPAAPDDGVLRINSDNVDELLERQTAPALVSQWQCVRLYGANWWLQDGLKIVYDTVRWIAGGVYRGRQV
jgi:hypothetical protein